MAHSMHEVEEMILGLCRTSPTLGITNAAVKSHLDGMEVVSQVRLDAINNLIKANKLAILVDSRDPRKNMFKLPNQAEINRMRGLSSEDLLVHQEIGQSGNKGIWQKELRYKTNLQQAQLNKSLKALEGKGLIKAVKTAASGPRKVFMLSNLQPDATSSVEVWHSDGELDEELISGLRELCFQYILQKKDTTLEEMVGALRSSGAVRQDLALKEEHYYHIVETLELDGKISIIKPAPIEGVEGIEHFRRAQVRLPESTALTNVPCGTCPVFRECTEGGVISPATCIYFRDWLQF